MAALTARVEPQALVARQTEPGQWALAATERRSALAEQEALPGPARTALAPAR
jgi:hypothetical protein